MKSHTIHRTFNTERRRELVRITDDVQAWINDDEPGLHEDVLEWLDGGRPKRMVIKVLGE